VNDAPTPSIPKGRVGVVARVEEGGACPSGRLVVLLEPAGLLTALVGSRTPVSSWLCHLLGDAVQIDGKTKRTVYIPDPCLTPISQMTAEQIRPMLRNHAILDLECDRAKLGRFVGGKPSRGAEPEGGAARRALQLSIERCLDTVSTETALREVGFKPIQPGRDVLHWVAAHCGVQLRFYAAQDPCGDWKVWTRGKSSRETFCGEGRLLSEGARGQLLQQVLCLWRSAFGRAPAPDPLAPAVTYEQHQAAMGHAAMLPRLVVDPQAFRAVRRWLVDRFGYSERTTPVRLSSVQALLRIEVDRMAFGCPAQGIWADGCEVDLGDLLDIDAGVLRRRSLTFELMPTLLHVNGWPIRASSCCGL